MSNKNFARSFKIRKYEFFNSWKRHEENSCTKNLKIRKCAFFIIFEKEMTKKNAIGILRFVSMLF